MQKQVAIALADAEFCKQEQATFTPDMLNIAAESALYLYEQLDLKLRKRLVYDRPYILDTLARSKWLLTKRCYHSLQGHPLKRAKCYFLGFWLDHMSCLDDLQWKFSFHRYNKEPCPRHPTCKARTYGWNAWRPQNSALTRILPLFGSQNVSVEI